MPYNQREGTTSLTDPDGGVYDPLASETSVLAPSLLASASEAALSALRAEEALDEFTDMYLGIKATAPTLDNDGDALVDGAIYFNSTDHTLYVRNLSAWEASVAPITTLVPKTTTITAGVGLTGGGDLSANRTVSMGTPSTLTGATTNSATGTTHTHVVTLVKADVGLSNIDNTSDTTKNAAVATLTNKTINLTNNTLSTTLAQLNTAVSDADLASLTTTQTLTNKTLALGSNTISGTLAEFNTALSDAMFASQAGVETLTNKSLFATGLVVGTASTTLPANTFTIIDRLGTSPIPALTAGTVLTLASATGTGSPAYLQFISGNAASGEIRFGDTDAAFRGTVGYDHVLDNLFFTTAGVRRADIDPNGSLLIGVTSGGSSLIGLLIDRGADSRIAINTSGVNRCQVIATTTAVFFDTIGAIPLVLRTNSSERARILSGGNFLIGTTGVLGTEIHSIAASNTSAVALRVTNTHITTPQGQLISYTAAAPNNTGAEFLLCNDSSTLRASLRSNGGLANFSANNVNLSDERVKKDFIPAKSYYSNWRDIEFFTFRYKDQPKEDLLPSLGVKAQQLRSIFPELVDAESGFGITPEDGQPLMTVYQTDFQYATAKALQEAIIEIEYLKYLTRNL